MLAGETVSPARLLFQYLKPLSNIDKLIAFFTPKITNLIKLFDNNGKSTVYTRGDIHGICCYLDINGAPTTLTTSGQSSHHFTPSSSTNNDTSYIQPVIADLRMRENIICELCGRIRQVYKVVRTHAHCY